MPRPLNDSYADIPDKDFRSLLQIFTRTLQLYGYDGTVTSPVSYEKAVERVRRDPTFAKKVKEYNAKRFERDKRLTAGKGESGE